MDPEAGGKRVVGEVGLPGVVPVAVGLFGLAEILLTAGMKNPPEVITPRLRELLPSRQEWRESNAPIWRGTVRERRTPSGFKAWRPASVTLVPQSERTFRRGMRATNGMTSSPTGAAQRSSCSRPRR